MPGTGAPKKIDVSFRIRKRINKRLAAASKDRELKPDKLVDQIVELWLIAHGY